MARARGDNRKAAVAPTSSEYLTYISDETVRNQPFGLSTVAMTMFLQVLCHGSVRLGVVDGVVDEGLRLARTADCLRSSRGQRSGGDCVDADPVLSTRLEGCSIDYDRMSM